MSALEEIKNKYGSIYGCGCKQSEIENAEKELDVTFANDYREYLCSVGQLIYNGHEMTGIGKSKHLDVVKNTKMMKEKQKGIPNDWYVIEDLNINNFVFWQDKEGRIFLNDELKYKSLEEYLLDL